MLQSYSGDLEIMMLSHIVTIHGHFLPVKITISAFQRRDDRFFSSVAVRQKLDLHHDLLCNLILRKLNIIHMSRERQIALKLLKAPH